MVHGTGAARRIVARILGVEEAFGAMLAGDWAKLIFGVSERAIRLAAANLPARAQFRLDDALGRRRFGNGELGGATKQLLRSDDFTRMKEAARATRAIKVEIATIKVATVAIRAHAGVQFFHRVGEHALGSTGATRLPERAHDGLVVRSVRHLR